MAPVPLQQSLEFLLGELTPPLLVLVDQLGALQLLDGVAEDDVVIFERFGLLLPALSILSHLLVLLFILRRPFLQDVDRLRHLDGFLP